MNYQGIIFDLDGVICSTDHFHYKAWKTLADSLDIPFDEIINNRLRGISRMESLNIVLEKSPVSYTEEEKLQLAEQKNTVYRELLRQMSPADLSDTVRHTLDTLRSRGLKMAIGSSSKNTPTILNRIGLEEYFDAVVDGSCITRSKPDPEVFLLAAQCLGLTPDVCMVVEDAHAGIEAAVSGGFDCAGMGDARTDERADYHLDDFSDLLKIV